MIEIRKLFKEPEYYRDMLSLSLDALKQRYLDAVQAGDMIFYGYLYQERKCFGLDYNDLIKFTLHIFQENEAIRLKWQKRLEYLSLIHICKGAAPMESLYSVKLGKLIQEFRLEVLRGGAGYEDVSIRTEDVNRPGLQLTGFFDYFDAKRLQVIGRVETTYLEGLTSEERRESFELLLSQDIPALIISREIEPFPECMEMAEKYDRTILRSPDTTSVLMSNILSLIHIC